MRRETWLERMIERRMSRPSRRTPRLAVYMCDACLPASGEWSQARRAWPLSSEDGLTAHITFADATGTARRALP